MTRRRRRRVGVIAVFSGISAVLRGVTGITVVGADLISIKSRTVQ